MSTTDQVWSFMLEYQAERGMPPTMDDIRATHPTLNYRSSAKYVLDSLVEEGRVEAVGRPGTSRRHRAVAQEGTSLVTGPDDLRAGVVPTERVED